MIRKRYPVFTRSGVFPRSGRVLSSESLRAVVRFTVSVPVCMLLFLLSYGPVTHSLEIDRSELESALEADIDFENYEGPVEEIESREAIRGIGIVLGAQISPDSPADYFGRYRVYRLIGDPTDPRRAADILELDSSSRVDHIENLRRIIAGYLEHAWGYRTSDADLLARFATIYNAVHRGDLAFFETRYRTAVRAALREDAAGLAITYREWPGKTQLVIPIRDDRVQGALDVVDPTQLIDSAVIGELRSRQDLGIDDRKAIIEFIERVIDERTEAVTREREEIAEERAQIDERIAEIDREDDAPPTEPAAEPAVSPTEPESDPPTDRAVDPPDPDADEPMDPPSDPDDVDERPVEPATQPADDPEPTERVAAAPPAEEREELAAREAELDEREERLRQEEAELEELTETVEELYQDTAEDQRALAESVTPSPIVPFILVDGETGYELALVDTVRLDVVGVQTIPLADRSLENFNDDLLVVHRNSGRILLLDRSTMEIRAESNRAVRPTGRIRVSGTTILAVVEDDEVAYIGAFDAQLVQTRRSVDAVNPDTDIVLRGEQVLVQGIDDELRLLDLRGVE